MILAMPQISVFNVPHEYQLSTPSEMSREGVVFIHGWMLSQCYWRPVLDGLGAQFSCLTYDLRGFGKSAIAIGDREVGPEGSLQPILEDDRVSPYSLAAYAQDLGELLRQLRLERVWLVGHSLGGSIALWAAKLFPQWVQGVICVNAGGGVYLPAEFQKFRQAGQQIVRWRSPWLKSMPLMDVALTRMMVHAPIERAWGKQRLVDLLAAHPEAAIGALLDSTTEEEVHRLPQVVASLRQPVYFIAGGNDTVMAEQYVRHLASFHWLFDSPESNVVILPECGHLAMVEQSKALADQIRQFVEGSVLVEEFGRSRRRLS